MNNSIFNDLNCSSTTFSMIYMQNSNAFISPFDRSYSNRSQTSSRDSMITSSSAVIIGSYDCLEMIDCFSNCNISFVFSSLLSIGMPF